MKQLEIRAYPMGDGCFTLRENSNDLKKEKRPCITLMQPVREAYDSIPAAPAASFFLYDKQVEALYAVLKDYYETA